MCLHIRTGMVWFWTLTMMWTFVNSIRRYGLIELAGYLQRGPWSSKIHFANNLDLPPATFCIPTHISTGNLISINMSIFDPHHMWKEPIENFTVHSTLKNI